MVLSVPSLSIRPSRVDSGSTVYLKTYNKDLISKVGECMEGWM